MRLDLAAAIASSLSSSMATTLTPRMAPEDFKRILRGGSVLDERGRERSRSRSRRTKNPEKRRSKKRLFLPKTRLTLVRVLRGQARRGAVAVVAHEAARLERGHGVAVAVGVVGGGGGGGRRGSEEVERKRSRRRSDFFFFRFRFRFLCFVMTAVDDPSLFALSIAISPVVLLLYFWLQQRESVENVAADGREEAKRCV